MYHEITYLVDLGLFVVRRREPKVRGKRRYKNIDFFLKLYLNTEQYDVLNVVSALHFSI